MGFQMKFAARCPLTHKKMFTKRQAQAAVNWRQAHNSDRLRVYHCPHCNLWHLTKQDEREK